MDMLENMRAFLSVAKHGSFTGAAEALGLVTSVVTKRVSQLERSVQATLLNRTTRRVVLSPDGEYHFARIARVVASYDETVTAIKRGRIQLEGQIRIKVPTTLGFIRLNGLIKRFIQENPMIDVEILLLDGPLNPRTEGIDIAVTAFPASFDGVADQFLWPLNRTLVASPAYLKANSPIGHPRELSKHKCIVYEPSGQSWPFLGPTGVVSVSVPARMSSNDMTILLAAVKDGMGVGLLTNYIVSDAIADGSVLEILPDYPVPDLWVKAMVPNEKALLPRVVALLDFLKSNSVAPNSTSA